MWSVTIKSARISKFDFVLAVKIKVEGWSIFLGLVGSKHPIKNNPESLSCALEHFFILPSVQFDPSSHLIWGTFSASSFFQSSSVAVCFPCSFVLQHWCIFSYFLPLKRNGEFWLGVRDATIRASDLLQDFYTYSSSSHFTVVCSIFSLRCMRMYDFSCPAIL